MDKEGKSLLRQAGYSEALTGSEDSLKLVRDAPEDLREYEQDKILKFFKILILKGVLGIENTDEVESMGSSQPFMSPELELAILDAFKTKINE